MPAIRWIMIVALVAWPSFVWAACGGSTPNWTSSADSASIAACLADGTFQAGDTITVSGNATYDTGGQLLINKSVNLIGSGTPVITRGTLGSGYSLFNVTLTSDVAVRISGFRFDNVTNDNSNYYAIGLNGKTDGTLLLTKIRLDHNYFQKGKRAVNVVGAVYGSIDSNTFNNCDIGVGVTGDNNYGWNRAIAAGTTNALFVEGNTFTGTEAGRDRNLNQAIYQQAGARSVTRYNTFDFSNITGSGAAGFYDSHGNQGGCDTPFATFRGQPIIEAYNNSLIAGAAGSISSYAAFTIRGGSSLIYNNDYFTSSGGGLYAIYLWEEEEWTSGNFSGPCTVWPSEDQIFNSFFWNNTTYWNGAGSGTNLTDVSKHSNNSSGTYIVKDRDYFMAAPAASGGKETLSVVATYGAITGSKYGDAMTFSAEGANAYNPYTPATCPNALADPLTTGYCNTSVRGASGYNLDAGGDPVPYAVTPSVASGNGTISPAVAEAVLSGADSSTYTATPENGWKVASWTNTSCGTATTCQWTNVTENKDMAVTFSEIQLMPW